MVRLALMLCGVGWGALIALPIAKAQWHGCGTGCKTHCQRFHCPPHLKHCQEGPPRICFECGCPRPICNPCLNPNWGYFEPCWNQWPWPPDFSHCRVPPPAASVILDPGPRGMLGVPQTAPPAAPPASELPAPRLYRPGL
jgi:hypothetical protein